VVDGRRKYTKVNEHYRLVDDDDVDNPFDLIKKRGDLIVLANEFVWVVLLLKFAVFIHDPENARLSNKRLVDAFIMNMGTKYYFVKEWAKQLLVEGETTIPSSVPTELQQQLLLKQLIGAYRRGNEQEINHLLVSAGLPYPVPMLHNILPAVSHTSAGASLYPSILPGAPFQQHLPVASLPSSNNNYYSIDRSKITEAKEHALKAIVNRKPPPAAVAAPAPAAPGTVEQQMVKPVTNRVGDAAASTSEWTTLERRLPSLEKKIAAARKTVEQAEEACELSEQYHKDSDKEFALFSNVIEATLNPLKLLEEQAKAVIIKKEAANGDQ